MAKTSEAMLDTKEEIIRKIHLELGLPIHHIRAVIDNQFRTANQAMKVHTSIEIAGFGKFTLIETRVDRMKRIYLNKISELEQQLKDSPNMRESSKKNIIEKIDNLHFHIKDLDKKKNAFELKRNSGRLEK